jgi:chorismate mutase
MQYSDIQAARDAGFITKIDDIGLDIEQINALSTVYESSKERGDGDADALKVAISQFKDSHKVKEGAWVEMSSDGTTTLYDVEIMSVGKWNGDTYTHEDLEDIESSYAELGENLKPYFKLGHDPKQKVSGRPAIGWIRGVVKRGAKLYATVIENVPIRIGQLIQKKAYGRISSEIYWNYVDSTTGKKYRRVLKAAALLGGETPAVDSMDDVMALYGYAGVYEDEKGEVHVCLSRDNEGEAEMEAWERRYTELKTDYDKLMKKIEGLDTSILELTKERDELKGQVATLTEERDEAKTELTKQESEGVVQKYEMLLEKDYSDRVPPVARPKIAALMAKLSLTESDDFKVTSYTIEDGKTESVDTAKLLTTVLDLIPEGTIKLNTESGKSGKTPEIPKKTGERQYTEDGTPITNAGILERIAELQKEDPKLSYEDASDTAYTEAEEAGTLDD